MDFGIGTSVAYMWTYFHCYFRPPEESAGGAPGQGTRSLRPARLERRWTIGGPWGIELRNWNVAVGICLVIGMSSVPVAWGEGPRVLKRAHAHNDYWHERPLLDALEQGFASVEADVFLVEGQLLVGHDESELRPERTLEALYLAPLRERVRENGGSLFGEGTRGTLVVDIKSGGAETYGALAKLLANYADVVSSTADGKSRGGAIVVVVSGNRPVEMIAGEAMRYAAADGRLVELNSSPAVDLIPLVSESWQDRFAWDGRGEMPEEERTKLRDVVRRMHSQGRRIRFWATPETEGCWRELVAADVDLIGTDDLARLARFLREEK
jgi:hypothetical protein